MNEERKKSPLFKLKNLPLMGDGVRMKLNSGSPLATGESNFGRPWYLWSAFVEDQTVYEGRGSNEKEVVNYSGEVIFFPSEKLNESLEKISGGVTGVSVLIKRVVEEGIMGSLITKYPVEKLSDGTVKKDLSSFSSSELKLIQDTEDLIREGHEITKDVFLQSAKDEVYGGGISEERAEYLFSVVK